MPTLADVAKEAGVSASTVSRTYTAPHLIHEDTRARVLSAASMLNYQPMIHRSARERAARQQPGGAHSIAFVYFSAKPGDLISDNFFYSPLLYAAHEEANEHGANLIVTQMERARLDEDVRRTLRDRGVSGMMLVGTVNPDILAAMESIAPSIVTVDMADSAGKHDAILSDGFNGAFRATKHLIDLGHRDIAFLHGLRIPAFEERYYGYVAAHLAAGLTPNPDLVVYEENSDDREDIILEFLQSSHRPTALFASNDCMAIAAINVCHLLGIRVPEEMSVIGYDDISFCLHIRPHLSTVRVDKEHMGRLAVRRLLQRVSETPGHAEPPVHTKIQVELILRDSCAPRRA